jgi:hypothetical protein
MTEPGDVARRWLPIAIALGAAGFEAAGAHTVALYLMLLAVPVIASCALGLLGELLDARAAGPVDPVVALEPFLAGLALLLVVAGTAAGSLLLALWGCLAVYGVQTVVGLFAELRSPAPEFQLER